MKNENRTLVIVDDDRDIQDLITAFFRPRGFHIVTFDDAPSALARAKTEGAQWDVMMTDLNLPGKSGIDLTVEMRKDFPHLPIILITTNRNAQTAVEAVSKGVYDFIVKPIHFPQLQISVERALHFHDLNSNLQELRTIVKHGPSGKSSMVGKSPKFLAALDIAKRVAKSKANIFIAGESGSGKEVFARFIHTDSPRAQDPFIALNCSAIPENLLESELFGHAKGAFTGAQDKKIGLFEEAGEGTLFLDEIGDLSLPMQAKLLRVIQERKIKRVGENQFRPIHCRIISATHKNLLTEIQEGRFREDLYFRLNVIPISIPPLRERTEDIVPLAEAFLKRFAIENQSAARSFSKEALHYIMTHNWRGNVRELENAIERAVILSTKSEVTMDDFNLINDQKPLSKNEGPSQFKDKNYFIVNCADELPAFEDVMNLYVDFAVKLNNGARDKTAKEIGIDRKTLYKRLKEVPQDLKSEYPQ